MEKPMADAQQASVNYPENIHPMFEANALIDDKAGLRQRLATDGYLLFRNVINPGKLQKLRDQITAVLADLGWIAGGSDRDSASVTGLAHREGEAGYFEALDRIVKLEELHALAHDSDLIRILRPVLGESVFPHPLSITRLVFPGHPEITTPPHQDYRNNQGTVNLTASWIPLGDCSIEQGGLAILEGSPRAGLLPLQYHHGPGNRGAILSDDLLKLRWVSTDYKLGDILLFSSLTVHSAMHNQHPSNMRLSVDYRYQVEGEALTPPCLQPHFGRTSWEEIYKDWHSEEHQYYWKDRQYIEVPWDPTLHMLQGNNDKQVYREGVQFENARRERLKSRKLTEANNEK
jgi:ectoine hydroxylase-related dioxygenase (phytanoyl-CoA dioxygenase family)